MCWLGGGYVLINMFVGGMSCGIFFCFFFSGYFLRFFFVVVVVVVRFLQNFRLIALVDMFFYTVWCSLVVQVSCCLKGFLITLKNSETSLE